MSPRYCSLWSLKRAVLHRSAKQTYEQLYWTWLREQDRYRSRTLLPHPAHHSHRHSNRRLGPLIRAASQTHPSTGTRSMTHWKKSSSQASELISLTWSRPSSDRSHDSMSWQRKCSINVRMGKHRFTNKAPVGRLGLQAQRRNLCSSGFKTSRSVLSCESTQASFPAPQISRLGDHIPVRKSFCPRCDWWACPSAASPVTKGRLVARRGLVAGRRLVSKSHRLEQASWEPALTPAIESGPADRMIL